MAESKRAIVTLFLRGVAMTYFFAFASLFVELPAIFLETGIIPLKPTMKRLNIQHREATFGHFPSLLWFTKYGTKRAAEEALIPIGLDLACTILCLVGMVAALLLVVGFPSKSKKISTDLAHRGLFFVLWVSWVSFVTLGQPMLGHDWDKLLVEVGFLCILLSPYENAMFSNEIGLVFLRWILFRVVFTTGALKLLGGDGDWRYLTTLDHFWQTTPLPTYLGYVLDSFHWKDKQLMQALWHFSDVVVPLMFLAPFRRLRISAGLLQVFIHLVMMFSANFQFYNILMIFTTFCLYDDRFLAMFMPFKSGKEWIKLFADSDENEDAESKKKSWLVSLACLGVEVFAWVQAYSFASDFMWHGTLKSQAIKGNQFVLKYTEEGLADYTSQVLVAGAALCLLDFAWTTYNALQQHGKKARSSLPRFALSLVFIAGQVFTFLNSLPTAARLLDKQGSLQGYAGDALWTTLSDVEAKTYSYRLTNQYDYFVNVWGRRTELIPQYSFDKKITHFPKYLELDMKYKPACDKSSMSPLVAPFAPRVDWQMADASVETSLKNGWVLHMMIKILKGEPEVMTLFDVPDFWADFGRPPTFMRFLARFLQSTSPFVESWDFAEWPEDMWQLAEDMGAPVDSKEFIEPIFLSEGAAYHLQFKPFGWDKDPKRKSIVFAQPFVLILDVLRWLTVQVSVGFRGLALMVALFTYARHKDVARAARGDMGKKVKTQ